MTETSPRIEEEMRHIITEAEVRGIRLRLIGGLAIKMHCPAADHRALRRDYPDIDFVTDKSGGRKMMKFLTQMGYVPDKTLNMLNGDRRQLYYDEVRCRQIDIFVGNFEMCHKLPMNKRLNVEPLTVPLAELFLSKAQIVELNRKDVLDMIALLLDHEVGYGDHETVNLRLITQLCARDWGLYTTTMNTIRKIEAVLQEGSLDLSPEQMRIVKDRLNTIRRTAETASKSFKWKVRARFGTRMRWYQEVEEVRR